MFPALADLTLISSSAPYSNWYGMYTVPAAVLVDGVLQTDPMKGPYCYCSTRSDLPTPHVKLQMKKAADVDKVKILVRNWKHETDVKRG